jgi:D-xylose transport system substrate-binding protein
VRAGERPPSGLVHGMVEDTTADVTVPSVLVAPQWVTASDIGATVLRDGLVTTTQLCAGPMAPDCQAAGIKP